MNEILFRAKIADGDNCGKFVYGFYMFTDDDVAPVIVDMKLYEYAILPETVGQFTRRVDKNGTKIFEGDILKNDEGNVGVVRWYDEHCAFMIRDISQNKIYYLWDNDFSKIEVVGNVYDDRKLLDSALERRNYLEN